ncbi:MULTISPECIES: NAD(P)-dependent oxidoreductase [unclassified Pseudomonas]|uniref:NAD-dependent epimerase/dehydratase family protein n=1 Tax=unclassified Pseudomonas TaxID=196821 RepID=UPI0011EE11C7|nr:MULTISPECIES: NAD(P)-dependent oxidoreductase [unclassified Pseudomonas]KAA0948222.1 NAD(P)-dependent oxidoreductase [Pseudomonas sp. ANT_H4]KAA0953021.1 NAD(P)-dependent oxidoreductase [Pseudomonas sp. ANT_H14]
MSIVVVGSTSLISRALQERPETAGWHFIGHRQALDEDAWPDKVRVVLNLAYNPALRNGYDPALDFELALARRVEHLPDVHYIMASSRMVYGPADSDGRLHEERVLNPVNPYGVGKALTENALSQLLGPRLTIVRLSNIFGYELDDSRRNFFAMVLRSLFISQRIVFDMSPFVERDFLPVEVLARWLVRVIEAPVPGIFNLGAGFGTPTGRIAQWLLEGFGGGELLINDMREVDAFWLDMQAAERAFGITGAKPNWLKTHCHVLGARLRQEHRLLKEKRG